VNWLAHAFLSEPDAEFRIGNVVADLVKGRERSAMSPAFQRGAQRHQKIDMFTDGHPVVHRSRSRIGDEYRRVAGILVDIFYDHFLARDWDRYSPQPLEAFTAGFYAEIQAWADHLPEEAQATVARMVHEDRLGSYLRIEGIEMALQRVSQRLEARTGHVFGLERAITELHANFDGLESDFAEFFPALQQHVAKLAGHPA
jgi:acyl carrier protein phosphodiesterase